MREKYRRPGNLACQHDTIFVLFRESESTSDLAITLDPGPIIHRVTCRNHKVLFTWISRDQQWILMFKRRRRIIPNCIPTQGELSFRASKHRIRLNLAKWPHILKCEFLLYSLCFHSKRSLSDTSVQMTVDNAGHVGEETGLG